MRCCARRGQADVRVDLDDGLPSLSFAARSPCRTRARRSAARPTDLGPADRRAPARRAPCGPSSRAACGSGGRRRRSRRASTPGSSSAPTQTCSSQRGGVVGLMLFVPSLKPMRLRGVVLRRGRRRRAAEPELGPAQSRSAAADAGEVAERVEGDLRVVGAALHGEVAAGLVRVEHVALEARHVDERGRTVRGETQAIGARRTRAIGPRPTVIVSRRGSRPSRLARVVGRRLGLSGRPARPACPR